MTARNIVLVVAAHSDDEALGCGGTIAKHVANEDEVYVAFMTNGVGARETMQKESSVRHASSQRALEKLGVIKSFRFDFPDNQMDRVPLLEVTKKVEDIIEKTLPNIVYTHFFGDLNIDHQVTHKAVMTACRPQSWCTVKEIYTFEVLSSTEWSSKISSPFLPQKIIDISDHWQRKLEALECYDLEMRDYPHSRSYETVKALAMYRGASHGVNMAEAFFVERIVE